MDLTGDFVAAQTSISQNLVATTRSAAQTSAQDTAFYRSLDPELGSAVDRQNARLLSLTQRLLRRCSPAADPKSLSLSNIESIDRKWRALVDVVDGLLERADACLDEYNGLIKRPNPKTQTTSHLPSQRMGRNNHGFRLQNIAKPQLQFHVRPSNDETEPFEPILTSKPHAVVPLEQSKALNLNDLGKPQFQHPYAPEIARYDYPSFVYTEAEPQVYTPFESTTADFVDDMEGVYQMVEELKKASVIAIDLEHHDTHSYVGIVSLMQISTRNHDWLVDTLKPWRRELEVLNTVFTDPSILKVFHGAHMDIMWLQRDFGLYVVGLFDTHHASRVLGYPAGSLAFLLKKFIDFDAQKQYQTADWRLRPLPQEMFDYARSDTHFLLYIYDCMRNELIAKSDLDKPTENMILDVLERSKDTAIQRYEHNSYDVSQGLGRGGWFSLFQRTPATLSKEQFAVFRKIHHWRDRVARQEDESLFQIMPNHAILNVARALPHDLPALLSALHPISQPVRNRSSELLAAVHEATVQATDGPEMNDILALIGGEIRARHLSPPLESGNIFAAESRLDTSPIVSVNGRAQSSQFWGSTLASRDELTSRMKGCSALFKTVPNTSYRAVALFATTGVPDSERSQTSNPYGTISVAQGTSNMASINPSASKRKLEQISEELPRATDKPTQDRDVHCSPSSNEDITHVMQKMRYRTERKVDRRNIRASGASFGDSGSTAFNYTTAPSVLHSEKQQGKLDKASEEQTPYNLYAKSGHVLPALGKAKHSNVGKSATFK